MNLSNKFISLLLGFFLICSSKNVSGIELPSSIKFISNEAAKDITTFITKKGIICRCFKIAGYAWAADVLTNIINDTIISLSPRGRRIVKSLLLATAYTTIKLRKFNNLEVK